MTELHKYIGADTDVPAGDIGTGAREIGFMYGQYKRLTGLYEGVLTGKGLSYGGSLARTEATGYGLLYLTEEMLKCNGKDIAGKTVAVSGAGNVAIYAIQKAQQLGAKPVTCSDSTGWIYDSEGIDVALLKEVKEVKRARLTEYAAARPSAQYHECAPGSNVWTVKCDIALPCATQNELDLEDAKTLVANGCRRRGHLRPGDEPEQRAPELDLRGSGLQAAGHHGKYLPQPGRCGEEVRNGRKLRGGSQYRRVLKGGGGHDGAGRGIG